MILDPVIVQLRTYAPMFGGRVAGAADFARATEEQTWMEFPAAYVIPLDETADENEFGNGLNQHVTERVGVIVALDNTADRRGQTAAATLADVRAAVWAAVLNWRVDPINSAQGFSYGGGRLLSFDLARLFYQFEFTNNRLLTDDDGWQEPTTPLTEIDVTVGHDTSAAPTLGIVLPQT